ncbi:hypothetical protein J2X68_002380 [Streptomyces sp. 3330]|uniref:hypothetical protein n=1 Tax=Streptomyces sp. 3330 TaxID=2817755 RepID=UPI0028615B80|nr:hypothetical protein [Streptomyces sp. 3330]MDR6975696.1 hypothetical protein [Streptomyces sp. 3330]
MFRPGESGGPPVRPIVYHPYAETDPASYESYADPAAAHGWENAYDETAQLPRVSPPEREPGGRVDRRRAERRAGGRSSRRVLAAAGAVGAVALAAVVAGMSFSGDPAAGQRGKQGDTRSADDAVSPSDAPASAVSGSDGSVRPTPSASVAAVPSAGGTDSASPSAEESADAAASRSASAAPSASASGAGSGKGNPGKGRGRDKSGR